MIPLLRSMGAACLFAAFTHAATSTPSFRVRTEFNAPLNADQGWAAAENAIATVLADQPFRVRVEVEASRGTTEGAEFQLQVRRNGGDWTLLEAHDFPHPESENAKTPRVSIVACAAFKTAGATTDLLRGATTPFSPGAGLSLVDRTPAWRGGAGHTEYEWPLVIRRFADDAVTNEEGDTFELRLVDRAGQPLPGARNPSLRLAIPPGHVGGTFVETPGRIGPFQARNGDLYFIMEPAETSNLFLMIKSTDHGRTWREVDAAHRPPTRDLESVDARQVGDTIHIIHQVTRSSRHHAFRTSDHPTQPDTWAVGGETIGTVQSVAQAASLVVRSDGSKVAFYVGQTKIHVSVRPRDGAWREQAVIDSAVGPQAVLGGNDTVHLAYYSPDGALWYRRFGRDGTLTPPESLASGLKTTRAEFGSVLPLVYLPGKDTVVIVYRGPTGQLWERRVVRGAAPTTARRVTDRAVVQNAVDSQQPGADVVADGETLHLLFIEEGSRSIYSTREQDGAWQPPTLRVAGILGSWVRGNIYRQADGRRAYGFIYDAGSDGGAGMNRFGLFPLEPR